MENSYETIFWESTNMIDIQSEFIFDLSPKTHPSMIEVIKLLKFVQKSSSFENKKSFLFSTDISHTVNFPCTL